jgi:PPIC-type PPIASE domain
MHYAFLGMKYISIVAMVVIAACDRAPSEPRSNPSPTTVLPTPHNAATPSAANDAPERVGARHVLVMHRGSERVPPTVTRTQEEARQRIQEVLARARRGDDFTALAREFSDEPGANTSGGDLGVFGHGQMVPPFEQAVFALAVGGISDVVETPFGYHVIKRTQ